MVSEIGQQLNVSTILNGSVRKSGNQIRARLDRDPKVVFFKVEICGRCAAPLTSEGE